MFIFMVMAVVALPLTSCNNDEPGNDGPVKDMSKHNAESDEDQNEITGYNSLEWFQNSIVVVDQYGNTKRRIYGEILDSSDSTILSVRVSDLAMAENIFLSWVAPEKNVEKVSDGYNYNMTDENGNAQGSVTFKHANGKNGVLATVSAGANTNLIAISEIRFISDTAWPENASTSVLYEAGKIYEIYAHYLRWDAAPIFSEDDTDPSWERTCMYPYPRNLPFYCIQGNDNGQEAILVYLSPDENAQTTHGRLFEYVSYDAYIHCASLPEAQKVLKYYTEHYQEWEAMIDYMESLGHKWDWHLGINTTGNEEFVLNSYNAEKKTLKILDLDSKKGKISDVGIYSFFEYRYIFVRTFPPYIAE